VGGKEGGLGEARLARNANPSNGRGTMASKAAEKNEETFETFRGARKTGKEERAGEFAVGSGSNAADRVFSSDGMGREEQTLLPKNGERLQVGVDAKPMCLRSIGSLPGPVRLIQWRQKNGHSWIQTGDSGRLLFRGGQVSALSVRGSLSAGGEEKRAFM